MKFSAVLDIGSSKVAAAAVSPGSNYALTVHGMGICPYRGYRLGTLPIRDDILEAISKAVELCEEESELKLKSICVGVPAPFTKIIVTSAKLESHLGKARISEDDIDRLVYLSAPDKVPNGYELLHSTPFAFLINGIETVTNPVGMLATSLEANVSHVYADISFIDLLRSALEELNIIADPFVASAMVNSSYIIPGEFRSSSCIVIDCGGNHCDVIHARDSAIIDSVSIGMGGCYITNDIAIGLRLPVGSAEELKRRFSFQERNLDEYERLFVPYEGFVSIKRSVIDYIISARVDELGKYLFETIYDLLPLDSVNTPVFMIGGGISALKGCTEYISDCIGRPITDGAALLDFGGSEHEKTAVSDRVSALALAHFMLYECGSEAHFDFRAVRSNKKILAAKL